MKASSLRQLLKLAIVVLLVGRVDLARADNPRTILIHSDPAVSQLEGAYLRYLRSARAGDVAGFRAIMSEQRQKDIAPITREILRRLTQDDIEPTKDAFARADISKDRARLIYSKHLADRIRWQGVALSRERGGWKIRAIVETIDPKNVPAEARGMLGKVGLDELLSHRLMQLTEP